MRITKRAVHKHGSFPQGTEHSVLAVEHGLHLDRRGQTRYHDVRVAHRFCRRSSHASLVRASELLCLGGGPVPHDEVEWIARQMRCHRLTNVAQSYKRNFHQLATLLDAAPAAALL